jgi:hypothetical protein
VRKGLEGRGAVAPKSKTHAWVFDFGVTEPPQSPVFCGAVCRAFFSPKGTGGGLLTANKFASTAGGKMRPKYSGKIITTLNFCSLIANYYGITPYCFFGGDMV